MLKLLLLDADVIIIAHELGVWDQLVQMCSISVTETIIKEANLWFDEDGGQHVIDLESYVRQEQIDSISVDFSKVIEFRKRFSPTYHDRMDPGESETLAFVDSSDDEWFYCSGDGIVFKVLGCLAKGHQGISLEEVLRRCGIGIPSRGDLAHLTREYRERHTRMGEQDSITGIGFSPS
jgi:hypothetical protein